MLFLDPKKIISLYNIAIKAKKSLYTSCIFMIKNFIFIGFLIAIEKQIFAGEIRDIIIPIEVMNRLENQGFFQVES